MLLHPASFPNIAYGVCLSQEKEIIWEACDNFQKQTLRNRYYIATDQGKHMLTIPIKHIGYGNGRQFYKEVHIDNSYSWQKQHFKTLETAYRTSPFFEYYEDDIVKLFNTEYELLWDFNWASMALITGFLSLPLGEKVTAKYEIEPSHTQDYRNLVLAKKGPTYHPIVYHQVFEDRHGFLENLSLLDLLFNEGPRAQSYLKEQHLPLLL